MKALVRSFCLATFTSAIAAQTAIVSPGNFGPAEGNHSWQDPIGSGTPQVRFLQVHADLVGHPMSINGIAFRLDEAAPANVQAFSIFVSELWCSTAAAGISAANPSSTFTANHGLGLTRVVSSSLVSFPATANPTVALARPFTHRVPFQTPFNYPGQGPLCWEISVTGRTNPPWVSFDAGFGNNANPLPYNTSFGTGCRAAGRTLPMTLNVSANNVAWGGTTSTLTFSGANAEPGSYVFCTIGVTNELFAGSILLPFVLPGSSIAPSGPCSLYADALLVLVTLADASGNYVYNIANDMWLVPSFNGRNTYYQAWDLSANANQYGLVFSNAVRHHWVAPYGNVPVGRVWAQLIAATGTANPFSGSVVEFY